MLAPFLRKSFTSASPFVWHKQRLTCEAQLSACYALPQLAVYRASGVVKQPTYPLCGAHLLISCLPISSSSRQPQKRYCCTVTLLSRCSLGPAACSPGLLKLEALNKQIVQGCTSRIPHSWSNVPAAGVCILAGQSAAMAEARPTSARPSSFACGSCSGSRGKCTSTDSLCLLCTRGWHRLAGR